MSSSTAPAGAAYSARVGAGLAYAANLHVAQWRKGEKTEPYLTHLLRAAMLALRYRDPAWGAEECDDVVIAAVLHDAAEDQGGEAQLARISDLFGHRVAALVRACSDSLTETEDTKADWFVRKPQHIAHVAADSHDDPGFALITTCDKISNLEDLLGDIRGTGNSREAVTTACEPFKGRVEGTCHYYRAMYRATLGGAPEAASAHLRRLVEELFALAGIAADLDSTLSPAEQFTTGLERDPSNGGSLR